MEDTGDERAHPLHAWTEPRTLLIGAFVLTMAFSEGTAHDWLGVATIDGYGANAVTGSLALGVFFAAMTIGRWFGPQALNRYGRVPVLRTSAAVALVGLLVVVFGPLLLTALVGMVLWGLGTALGFPVGMSAAADDPRVAPGRVSVVATIGYVAFLAGPPAVGLLGDRTGVLRALTVTAGMLAIGLLLASATDPSMPTVIELVEITFRGLDKLDHRGSRWFRLGQGASGHGTGRGSRPKSQARWGTWRSRARAWP